MTQREWFRFTNKADEPKIGHISIYDAIGPWYLGDNPVSASAFIANLDAMPADTEVIRLHVNSPGGDVSDAVAIANALRQHPAKVEAFVEGMAASAATIPLAYAERVVIFDNARMLVHNPMAAVVGDATRMRDVAEQLDGVRDQLVSTYSERSPLNRDELVALMNKGRWMNADTAIANGFATEKAEGIKVTACFRPEALAKLGDIPDEHKAAIEALIVAPTPEPTPHTADPAAVIRACKAAGFPELAEDLLSQPMAAVEASLAERKTAKVAADARATEIRALCSASNLPDLADDYIAGGMALAQVKAQLLRVKATLSAAEIDGTLPTGDATRRVGPSTLSVTDIYRERNTPRTTKGVTP